jgi:aminopeptidase N
LDGEVHGDVAEGGIMMLGMGMDSLRYGPSVGGWWTAPEQIFVAGEPRGAETWYPVNGHPADKATYTLRLTVDRPYDVVSIGERVAFEETEGTRTATWFSAEPAASYLVTFYAGDIDIVTRVMENGPALRYAYGVEVPDWQREQMETLTPRIIDHYAELFGEYPFEVAGGMIVDGVLWFALETQTIPVHGVQTEAPALGMTREVMLEPIEEIIAHELAHQWFGNAVSPLRWRDVYLNEGLTQYATYLWIEERDGRAAMETRLRDVYDRLDTSSLLADPAFLASATGADLLTELGEIGQAFAPEVQGILGVDTLAEMETVPAEAVLQAFETLGIDRGSLLGTAPVLTGDPGPDDNFSTAWIYERGALATHALRVHLGDERFFAVLRAWGERQRYGSATVQDFIALAEAEAGESLSSLFGAWLYQREMPPFPETAPVPATPVP